MLGRGYKVYGSIGPKTTFGFNSLIGYSDEPNFIEFDDGTIIEVSFGKMVISGIVLGERSFNFEDQSTYFYYHSVCHRFEESVVLFNKIRKGKGIIFFNVE